MIAGSQGTKVIVCRVIYQHADRGPGMDDQIGSAIAGHILEGEGDRDGIGPRTVERRASVRDGVGDAACWELDNQDSAVQVLRQEVARMAGFNFLTEQLKELLFISVEDLARTSLKNDPVNSHKSVSRFTLRQVLLIGLEDVVHFNKRFLRYEETADGKFIACFEDGTTADCDVLVGADGSSSRVRKQFLPHAPRIETSIWAIQGKTILTDEIKPLLPKRLYDGPASITGLHGYGLFIALQQFQHKPAEIEEIAQAIQLHPNLLLSDTADFIGWGFLANRNRYGRSRTEMEQMDGAELKQIALEKITDWHPHLQKLIRAADLSTVIFTPIQTSLPIEHWQTKQVTLIGDAIHSMTPARGIGANTALRDAALLGRKLAQAHQGQVSLLQALQDYELEMVKYGFDAVMGSKKALEQTEAQENPLSLAMTRTTFRIINAVPPLKRHLFRGFGAE